MKYQATAVSQVKASASPSHPSLNSEAPLSRAPKNFGLVGTGIGRNGCLLQGAAGRGLTAREP
jgi:hypothetical protein